jgi:hypothetical protein
VIDFKAGSRYLIRDYVTLQGALMECQEVLPHRGHYVVYGRYGERKIKTYKSVTEFAGRPVCFPQLRVTGERGEAVTRAVIRATRGTPDADARPLGNIRISAWSSPDIPQSAAKVNESLEETVISSNQVLFTFWGGSPYKGGWWTSPPGHETNRDGMVLAVRKVIDLAEDYLASGIIPSWFIEEDSLSSEKLKAPTLKTPDWAQPTGHQFKGIWLPGE